MPKEFAPSPELLDRLKYYRLRFTFQADAPILLPGYKGSPWRGLFGHTLKRIVCPFRRNECQGCMLGKQCIYLNLFETPKNGDTQAIPGANTNLPHPFILVPPLERRNILPAGETFVSEMILLARQAQMVPYLVLAFHEMGQRGLGKEQGKFTLTGAQVWNGEDWQTVFQDETLRPLPAPTLPKLPERAIGQQIRLRALTPLRLRVQGGYSSELPFSLLFKSLLRRTQQLAGLQGDHRELAHAAESVETASSNLHWFDIRRFSSRQQTQLGMGGLEGEITYRGGLAPFAPWLALGEILHVGSLTSFGLGKFCLEWKED